MNEIVCQVCNRENQVEFVWSAGGGFFRPYTVTGAQLGELREATHMVRKALGEMVSGSTSRATGPLRGNRPTGWPRRASASTTTCCRARTRPRKIRKWLEELRKQTRLDGLEIVLEEQSADPRSFLSVPWNLIYDERPAKHKPAFQSSKGVERWRPFWSIRYNLTSG